MAGNTYVFGYGSLIEKASRTRTNPDAIGAWPARVAGYQRGWFHQFANNVGSTCTYLGAIENAGATINGVVYKVGDIEKTKERETGYTATRVDGKITMLDGSGAARPDGRGLSVCEQSRRHFQDQGADAWHPYGRILCGYLHQWLSGNRSTISLGCGVYAGIY